MNRGYSKLIVVGVLALVAASGCTTRMVEGIEDDVGKNTEEVQRLIGDARRGPQLLQQRSAVEVHSGAWVPARRVKLADEHRPGVAAERRQITVNANFFRIQEVAERITLLMGIPATVSADAIQYEVDVQSQNTTVAGGSGLQPLPPIPGSAAMPPGGAMSSVGAGAMMPISISYSGPLAGFLDAAAARFNVFWEWEGEAERIRFFRHTSKTFRIVALPGNTKLSARISNQGGGGSNGGSGGSQSNQETSVTFDDLSVWVGIEEAVKNMLTEKGKAIVTPATGTITVTDTPNVIAKVEQFVRDQNASLARQVVVNVRVLSVELSDSDNYGINWDLVYQSLSGNFGWSFSNSFATDPGASNLALRILSTAGSGTASNVRAWAGSEAILSALSKQGRVSQLTSASVTTLNNQPVPVQVGRQTAYLASSQTTISDGQSSTSLQPGTISTGFAMNLVPHILDQQNLLLQYAIDISSLLGLTTVTSGDSSIQTPEIETRNFLQRVKVGTGDTLVVAGFEQNNLNATTQGVGNARNTALGGGVGGNRQRSVLVVLIQPVIADN